MPKIIISADSTCDLSQQLIEQYKVKILPMIVNFGLDVYRDNVTITADEIYARVEKEKILPKTSAISIGEYLEFFQSIRENDNDIILHFSISTGFSSTHQNATLAANETKNIYTYDSRNLSTGIGLSLLKACKMRDENYSLQEIIEVLDDYVNRVDASFLIDTLEYLHKGGRCSALQKLGATMFSLKPCIEVKQGKMSVGKKFRGRYDKVLLDYVDSRFLNTVVDDEVAFVTHAGCDEALVNKIAEKVRSLNLFKEVLITRAGCTVSTHCGRNTLGVLFVHKEKIVG